MRKSNKVNQRIFITIAGIFAVVIVLTSSSFYQTKNQVQKESTEQSDNSEKAGVSFIGVGNDAVQGAITQVATKIFLELETFLLADGQDDVHEHTIFVQDEFIKTLFRVIISPNAP